VSFSSSISDYYEGAKDRMADYFKEAEMISFKFREDSGKRCINYVGDVPRRFFAQQPSLGWASKPDVAGWHDHGLAQRRADLSEPIPLLSTILERNAERGQGHPPRDLSGRRTASSARAACCISKCGRRPFRFLTIAIG
jgi:hypothetical protein